MLGTLINTMTVIGGSFIRLVVNKGIPERISQQMMRALGLCTLFYWCTRRFQG